jgi:hypothetical protein
VVGVDVVVKKRFSFQTYFSVCVSLRVGWVGRGAVGAARRALAPARHRRPRGALRRGHAARRGGGLDKLNPVVQVVAIHVELYTLKLYKL